MAATLAAAVAVLLGRFPPDRYNFYPRCPVANYLHLECPGCGTTRALAALLHGRVIEALHLNALTMALLPIVLIYIARNLWRQRREARLTLPHVHPYVVYTLLVVTGVFTIIRNLPL